MCMHAVNLWYRHPKQHLMITFPIPLDISNPWDRDNGPIVKDHKIRTVSTTHCECIPPPTIYLLPYMRNRIESVWAEGTIFLVLHVRTHTHTDCQAVFSHDPILRWRWSPSSPVRLSPWRLWAEVDSPRLYVPAGQYRGHQWGAEDKDCGGLWM